MSLRRDAESWAAQDSEAVAEHLVARGEASQALLLLRRPDTPRELIYKFAPPLMAAAAEATVDFWLTCHPPLEPSYASHLPVSTCLVAFDLFLLASKVCMLSMQSQHSLSLEGTSDLLGLSNLCQMSIANSRKTVARRRVRHRPVRRVSVHPILSVLQVCHSSSARQLLNKCRRVLPALLRIGNASAHGPTRRQALRYVEFALDRLQCQVSLDTQLVSAGSLLSNSSIRDCLSQQEATALRQCPLDAAV